MTEDIETLFAWTHVGFKDTTKIVAADLLKSDEITKLYLVV